MINRETLIREIKEYIKKLIGENEGLELVGVGDGVTTTRFVSTKLDDLINQTDDGRDPSKRLLVFQFDNRENYLDVNLHIRPAEESSRIRIYNLTAENDLFNKRQATLSSEWSVLYGTRLINHTSTLETEITTLLRIIKDKFETFCQTDLLNIEKFFSDNASEVIEGSEVTKLNSIAPLNQILFGPPGTGKTYHTIEAAVKAAEPQFYASLNIDAKAGTTPTQRKELTAKYNKLSKSGHIRFVTFHQSYGYEEFVEGLKAETNEDNQISYKVKDGIFKSICESASSPELDVDKNINTSGRVWKLSIESAQTNPAKTFCLENNIAAIGWGDTGDLGAEYKNDYYNTLGKNDLKTLEYFSDVMTEGDLVLCINSKTSVEAIGVVAGDYEFIEKGLPSRNDYCHHRKVTWLAEGVNVDFKSLNGDTAFDLKTCTPLSRLSVPSVVKHLAESGVSIAKPEVNVELVNYVLVIDEINRGNISKIFGELITLIEPSKRAGNDEAIEVVLPNSSKPFSVPNNLHIIGTMNTADRSLAMMDTALRRRFDFKEMMPKPALFDDECGVIKGINLTELLTKLNKRIEVLHDREHTLGHAFFFPAYNAMVAGNENEAFIELQSAFQNKIIPLLEEYFYDDWNKISLVLGDNQKSKHSSLQFVKEELITYTKLFGKEYQSEEFGQPEKQYALAEFTAPVWSNKKAYQAIYAPKNVTKADDQNE
ncbi:AAA family ATPase [Psychromonas sp. Urea-02u-13]|uniref:AAA family ATPase n=1 Tax=Psychromonas sp. Urea-02u-13 TaxID=2058326 RepID=UPI000C345145|nr:AAA family ATPase [Psychromonas sp. Urea-02u-13]PKG38323.1 AAA family ATPase [Psychromonas sp. Urea-02u-13]